MFYEDSEIDSLLNCQNCNYKYEEPYLLPCGYTICQKCSLLKDKNCSFCHQKHEAPTANYPLNQIILKLLEMSPKEIYRGEEAAQLKQNIKYMNEKFNLLSNDFNNKEDKIKEHCIELKRQVQLKTEQTLSKINELNESLINQIDTFEKDWIENLKAKSEFNTNHIDHLKTQVTQFSNEQTKYLQQIQLDESEMNEANALAESYRSIIDQCLDDINVFVFNGKQFEFESSVLEMDEHSLGHFYARTFIDIKKFRTFCIDDELADKKEKSSFCVFIKRNDNYLIVYHSDSDNLVAITVDLLLNKIEKKIICTCLNTYNFFESTSFIAVNFLNEDELDTLAVLDECANIVFKCDSFDGKYLKGANDEFILCTDDDENFIIFDWQLNTVGAKIKFQFDDSNKAFYLPDKLSVLTKIDKREGRFIFSYDDYFSLIDESSGMVIKTITIDTDYLESDYFKINADNKLMVADELEQKLIAYDLNGNLSFEIKLNGFKLDYLFLFASKNKIHFYDAVSNKIFYE